METKGKRSARDAGSDEASPEPMVPVAEPSAVTIAQDRAPTTTAAAEHPAAPEPVASTGLASAARTEPVAIEGDFFAAVTQSQAMLARGLEALSNEMAGLARSEIGAAARGATELLAAKTVVDAIEVNLGFARSSLDNWLGSAARLSELGAGLAAEASQTLLAQLGKSWSAPSRLTA